jgi:hypothetical protein
MNFLSSYLKRSVCLLLWGAGLIPALASCQEKVPQGWVTTPNGVTGFEQPPQTEQAPIDESTAQPMPMPSIDGPPVKPDPRDAKIKHPGPPGSEEGSAGEGR